MQEQILALCREIVDNYDADVVASDNAQQIIALIEGEYALQTLKRTVFTGDVDEILDACKDFIKFHRKDAVKFIGE